MLLKGNYFVHKTRTDDYFDKKENYFQVNYLRKLNDTYVRGNEEIHYSTTNSLQYNII